MFARPRGRGARRACRGGRTPVVPRRRPSAQRLDLHAAASSCAGDGPVRTLRRAGPTVRAPIPMPQMKAILLIDHGSKRDEANHMRACMTNLVQAMAGDSVVVEYAHMELAEPASPRGFAACVERGATEVIAFPYMLSPG